MGVNHECPWCQAPVTNRGDTCDEVCYRRWIGTHHGIIPDDVQIPNPHWFQPWYMRAQWRTGENNSDSG